MLACATEVKSNDGTIRACIISTCDRPEFLLSSCIPNMRSDNSSLNLHPGTSTQKPSRRVICAANLHILDGKIDADSRLWDGIESSACENAHHVRLSHPGIPNNDKLKELVITGQQPQVEQFVTCQELSMNSHRSRISRQHPLQGTHSDV